MYRIGLEKINELQCKAQKENKIITLTYKEGDKLYKIKDYIIYLQKIENVNEKNFATATVKFLSGELVQTGFYLDRDNSIKEGQLISILGYIAETKYGIQLVCKGGASAVLTNARQIQKFNLGKTYRFGIIPELSKFELSETYDISTGFRKLSDDLPDFYYKSEEQNETEISSNCVDTTKNLTQTIDTSQYTGEEVEDYPED